MKDTVKAEIGARIRMKREQAGLTREHFGELCSLSPRFIANVELGDSAVSVDTLITICKVLSCGSDDILFGTFSGSPWNDTAMMLHQIPERYQPQISQVIRSIAEIVKKEAE